MEAYRLKLFRQLFPLAVLNGENVDTVEERGTVHLNLVTGYIVVVLNGVVYESPVTVEDHDNIEFWLYTMLK